jgi:hypothetical protein
MTAPRSLQKGELHPLQKAFIDTTVFSAAIERLGRSARPWERLTSFGEAFPAT